MKKNKDKKTEQRAGCYGMPNINELLDKMLKEEALVKVRSKEEEIKRLACINNYKTFAGDLNILKEKFPEAGLDAGRGV